MTTEYATTVIITAEVFGEHTHKRCRFEQTRFTVTITAEVFGEHMGRNSIIPAIIEALQRECKGGEK